MNICIAQSLSKKGNVQKNIQNHLKIIESAIDLQADLIIFPELSITNYEPKLAEELATDADDPIFNPFQTLSDQNHITIGVGMPTIRRSHGSLKNEAHPGAIKISLILFRPNLHRLVYSKQMLDADEKPFFTCGDSQIFLDMEGKKIAFGICYETLRREHFVHAKRGGADIYVASVAKPKNGLGKAYEYFPKMADEFKTPILMANCIGPCDNFLSLGQSAIWNGNGQLIGKLDSKNQGVLLYDTDHHDVASAPAPLSVMIGPFYNDR